MFKKLLILFATIFIITGCKQKEDGVTPPIGFITISPAGTTDIESFGYPLIFNISLRGDTTSPYRLIMSNDITITEGSINGDNTMFSVNAARGAKKGQTVEIYIIEGSTPPIKSNTITLTVTKDIIEEVVAME